MSNGPDTSSGILDLPRSKFELYKDKIDPKINVQNTDLSITQKIIESGLIIERLTELYRKENCRFDELFIRKTSSVEFYRQTECYQTIPIINFLQENTLQCSQFVFAYQKQLEKEFGFFLNAPVIEVLYKSFGAVIKTTKGVVLRSKHGVFTIYRNHF